MNLDYNSFNLQDFTQLCCFDTLSSVLGILSSITTHCPLSTSGSIYLNICKQIIIKVINFAVNNIFFLSFIGYEVDLPKANMLVRASVDSNMNVKSTLEKKLRPLPFSLALCGMLNHQEAKYQFGCGVFIGE